MGVVDQRLLLLSDADNVFVVRGILNAGDEVRLEFGTVKVADRIGLGHKLARLPIAKGERIVKYGAPIGSAVADISAGDHVHIHNVQSNYTPTIEPAASEEAAE